MEEVVLHLGSNIGDRMSHLNGALTAIKNKIGPILKQSMVYETEAWGRNNQDDFLNLALITKTSFSAIELLKAVKEIEDMLGRTRTVHWGPRIIDIDIIFFGNEIVNEAGLTIPHLQMQNRNFVLIPLLEIVGDKIHPQLNKSVEELYIDSKDEADVWIYNFN